MVLCSVLRSTFIFSFNLFYFQKIIISCSWLTDKIILNNVLIDDMITICIIRDIDLTILN